MPINLINILFEFNLWSLFFGITFSNATVEVCVIMAILLFFAKATVLRKVGIPKTSVNLFIYTLALIVFISFLRSPFWKESIRGVVRIIKYPLLFFAIVDFLTEDSKRMRRLFWALICVSIVTYANGIFQSIWAFDFLRHRVINKDEALHRINASFVHPNDFGAFIISVLPLSMLFLALFLSKLKRFLLCVISIAGIYCLLQTSSRAAWLGFFCAALIFLLFYNKRIALIAMGALASLFFVFPHGMERVTSLFRYFLKGETNTVWERIQLWKGTSIMIGEHPVLGFGINTFSKYFPQYKPPDYPDVRYCHNSYLQMWSEIGIIGLAVFLLIVVTIVMGAIRYLKINKDRSLRWWMLLSLTAGYVAFLVQSGFDTNLYSLVLTTLFWSLSAVVVALTQAKEK
jgi:putative inorganic carbon (HCO3(-)) transporter